MGYSVAEARLGLRASMGDRKLAVEKIINRREEKADILKKEKEERERGKLRDKLGKCADGSWVNIGYFNTLKNMGFSEKVAAAALRQANNSLNMAVQLLQEEPDLITLAAEEMNGHCDPTDEMVASVVSMGFEADMARAALRKEGTVERAVEELMENGGIIQPVEDGTEDRAEKRRRTDKDEEAYNRIKEDIADNEEDHLDTDLVEEGQLLHQYLNLLK